MPESHERILRRIIRRFGSFPTRTYSNRISNDANVRITYEESSGRVLNFKKRAPNLSDVSPYVGERWQIYGRVTGALYIQNAYITLFYSISIPVRRCSAVPLILNARPNTTASYVGSVVRITCLDGYVFPGNKTNQMLTCGANREWRPKIGHCRRT